MRQTMLNVEAAEKLELKAERVQQQIARLLGWQEREGVGGIHRAREFASYLEAEAFSAFVFKLAGRRRQAVTVSQAGKKVSITLSPGRTAGLTDAVYDLACALG